MADFFFNPATQKKVGEVVGDGITVFTTNFSKSYRTCYIQSIKEEAQSEEEVVYLLLKPPAAAFDLRKSTLTKRSDVLKQWRERTCIVTNEADNFRVNFFAGERLTGFVDVCGYDAEKLSEGFGINLVPKCERRKTWFLKCKSEEEQDAWMEVFDLACAKSQSPVSKDPVLREAFSSALTATRAHFGYHRPEPVVMTEPETITDLLNSVIDRDVLTEAHKSMGIVTTMVRNHVRMIVDPSVAACWKSCMSVVEPTKQAVDTAVKPALTSFFEKEAEVKEKITEAIGDKVNPFLEEHSKKTLEPVLDCVCDEILSTFSSTVKDLHAALVEAVAKEEFKAEETRKALIVEMENAIAVQEGVVAAAKKTMDECVKSKFTKIAGLLDKGFSIKTMVQKIMAKNEQLASYAVFTFTELGADADANVAISDTVDRMISDASKHFKELVEDILGCVLADPIAETVAPPCVTAVEPIQETINSFEGLSDFFQLDALLEDCIGDSVSNAIGAASEGSVTKGCETIAALKAELKV